MEFEYLFTCKNCRCHSYGGPIRIWSFIPTIICMNCFHGEEASDEFLKAIRWNAVALK